MQTCPRQERYGLENIQVRTDGRRGHTLSSALIEHNTWAVTDAKRQISGLFHCIALFRLKSGYSLFLKSKSSSTVFALDGADVCEQAGAALSSAGFAAASTAMKMRRAIRQTIQNIPTTTKNFSNRGVFSIHYLKSRLLKDIDTETGSLEGVWNGDAMASLRVLGWTGLEGSGGVYRSQAFPEASIVVVDRGVNVQERRRVEARRPVRRGGGPAM